MKLDTDSWVTGPVGIDQFRQKQRCCPANAADGQSAGCALRRSASAGSRFFNSIENVFSLAKESLSCGRKSNRAFGSDEQFYLQLFLKRSDLLTDGRLSNVQLFRRSGKALLFGNSHKVKKITEFHSESVRINPSSLPTAERLTGSTPKSLKRHSRNKTEMMTAGSIFVRNGVIVV
jgi:hypothetical protein